MHSTLTLSSFIRGDKTSKIVHGGQVLKRFRVILFISGNMHAVRITLGKLRTNSSLRTVDFQV